MIWRAKIIDAVVFPKVLFFGNILGHVSLQVCSFNDTLCSSCIITSSSNR